MSKVTFNQVILVILNLMKLSKHTLISLFTVVIVSLAILVVIQFRILKKDIEINQNIMEFAIPGILSDIYDNMVLNVELEYHTSNFEGTEEFSFTNTDSPKDPTQQMLKVELDRVLSLNYPQLNYRVDGFISNQYGCLIHTHHRPDLPKAQSVLSAENHLCFCMILDNTLDIAMTYTNKQATVLNESASILIVTFLLIVIIISAFAYTIYTINRQKKLSDLKRDFINNLTHEFKTPIFSISLAAKSLQKSPDFNPTEKMSSYIELISNENKRLQTQVDKILQIALLDSGNLTLEKKKIDLHDLIQKVAESFKIIIEEKKGTAILKLNATNSIVIADETHLNNIVYNLIDNAQKYCDKTPKIEISTHDSKEGILLTIKDNGIGMKKEVQRFVFDQFYRAQKGNVHNIKGFGLGLSYVKNIVEAHKGWVGLTSEFNKGSEFTICLPTAT